MKQIILATSNPGKVFEIQAILSEYQCKTLKDIGFTEEIIENGDTFESNALIKARAVWKQIGGIVVADDSGLVVDYLGGEPGIYSARYLGEDTSYDIKNANIIERLKQAKGKERSARFIAVVACILSDGSEIIVDGKMEGEIAYIPKGENGFGYDPILYLPDYACTSAELSNEQKNALSHRGEAFRKLKQELQKYIG